ncbi:MULTISPECIES: hypothetical protein [Burkholderia cepacia complex]|uniref:hypothetical protein n=1 Tax=Burkholderia cepacia complex TaxID=87882 RepID=UPI001F4BA3AB|nr:MULTISPECIES: hypothetical protein [Burkholderia cepacia complex]MDN7901472.1 hypothetical protein [Burkholderia cepacia]
MTKFFEVTIVSDSDDTLVHARKALIRPDEVTCVVDVSAAKYAGEPGVKITLEQSNDYVNEDDDAGGVVQARRTIFALESYEAIKQALQVTL